MTNPENATKQSTKTLVSIIIPVFNDEEYIKRALESATAQSLKSIEIVCVDDCSSDNTVAVIEEYAQKDPRVKLIQQTENASAFQARRVGILSAQSKYILFLDGDDQLHKDAAKLSYKQAEKTGSDIVGFGATVVRKDGSTARDFENSLQPVHKKLTGSAIVASLFESGQPAQGSMWRFLFSKKLLLNAYSYFPDNQKLYRANDLPITFLSVSLAKKYTSIANKLYVYHYYAGGSGSANFTIEKFKFYTNAIESINLIGSIIKNQEFRGKVRESYDNACLFVISNIIRQIETNLPEKDHAEALSFLLTKTGLEEITYSVAAFIPEAIGTIRTYAPRVTKPAVSKNIAIFTNNLNTGGVQGVVVSQAEYLQKAGYHVTILLLNDNHIVFNTPQGVDVVTMRKGPLAIRLKSFHEILKRYNIDTVIDHNILYNFSWPLFSLIARSLGIKTMAWIHSFALRPITEGKSNGKFLLDNIGLIDDLVVLSEADVSYWKSLGHENTYYLPNPPSPLLLEKKRNIEPKNAPDTHLNIVWFGRLQQATKKVYSLIDVAAELKKLTNDFTLTVVGPDSEDLRASQLQERVNQKNLRDNVKIVGPKHGDTLVSELKKADVYLTTSIIEGYPLTLLEAQSYALPVVMYELPWLAIVNGNNGIIQTPQKNPSAAAQQLFNLFNDKTLYKKTSKASLKASESYLSFDFAKLYTQLLKHNLPQEFSPKVKIEHLSMFAEWTQIFFAEVIEADGLSEGNTSIREKDAEIRALKNSKAMQIGNIAVKPLRVARVLKHKVVKRLKKR